MDPHVQDSLTHAHATELLCRGIHTLQPAHNELIVECIEPYHSTYAVLYLNSQSLELELL